MGRVSTFKYLTPEQHAIADACIRRYRYARIDAILEELQAADIKISRSALGRYMKQLGESDGMLMETNDATVVTIVDRASGNVMVLKTAVNWSALASYIRALGSSPDIS